MIVYGLFNEGSPRNFILWARCSISTDLVLYVDFIKVFLISILCVKADRVPSSGPVRTNPLCKGGQGAIFWACPY